MERFYHDDSREKTYDEVVDACRKGYGIKHPERVNGFQGFFFRLHDVYLYGKLEDWVLDNPKLEEPLMGFIRRFAGEDYGFITSTEYYNNLENKWLCGSCSWTIGRYYFEDQHLTHYGGIVLEFFRDCGVLYSIEEDVSELYAEYAGSNHSCDLVYTKCLVNS